MDHLINLVRGKVLPSGVDYMHRVILTNGTSILRAVQSVWINPGRAHPALRVDCTLPTKGDTKAVADPKHSSETNVRATIVTLSQWSAKVLRCVECFWQVIGGIVNAGKEIIGTIRQVQ